MPKSAKKRRDKAADFSKAKLKLGKGKQLASNAIDTSFKARSIALPTQSIAQEKDITVPSTKRRLTFEDLIAHTKHYNATTRKDAILGLRELLDAHWALLDSSLAALINACVRMIGDEDASVRKALLTFFSWLLPRIPQEDLVPHSPLLLLFTTSAQTHIFPEIRIDAIRFLNLFLECIPQAVIAGWDEGTDGHGARILEGYLGILNAGTKFGETDGPLKATSTASVVLMPASKLVVLQSLSTFLQSALSSFAGPSSMSSQLSVDPSSSVDTWYLASSFAKLEGYYAFEELLQPGAQSSSQRRTWVEEVDPEDGGDDFPYFPSTPELLLFGNQWSLHDLADVANAIGTSDCNNSDGANASFVTHLARTLHSTLIATFLDCAPAVFSPSSSPSETEAQLILAVARIARSLYGVILQAPTPIKSNYTSTPEDLGAILNYMTPYFPFKLSGSRDIKLEQAFQDLNLIFCELSSLLVLTTHEESSRLTRRGRIRQKSRALLHPTHSNNTLSIQTLRVNEYILQLLRGEPVSSSQLGKPLTPAAYSALLPAIWALLNDATLDHREVSNAMLLAILEHSVKTSSKSALKKPTLEFISRLLLLDTEPLYQGSLRFGRDVREDQKLEEWVTHLPQPLWEFGSNNLPASEIILRFLLRILQRKSGLVHATKTVASLRSKLIPYFSITHAVRGQLLGPYSKLPVSSPLRRLALDLVVTLLQTGHDDSLCAAVDLAVANTNEQCYWTHVRRHV
ncbi:Testis-expressed sequence 10 protein [Hypsizygus marmoreus]|uniref:Pre-rRNA-processing protein n=1 Tax=Hypsizygus marmoreus TaxID=39966 RepID=A0A369KCC7_HYPMA|nr:Testis-expressed sequence 10 protein [Hypsizygus marmoreus]